MKHLVFALFVSLLAAVACTPNNPKLSPEFVAQNEASIINGEEVKAEEVFARQTIRLFYRSSAGATWYPMCTGSILANDLILTAVHCVEGTRKENLLVGFGAQPVSGSSQRNPATRVDVPATFKTAEILDLVLNTKYDGYGNDVALLRIKTDIPAGFEPATLLPLDMLNADHTQTVFEGKFIPVILAGFGVIDERNMTDSLVLRKATVNADFKGKEVITDQTKGFGGCFGDSGGPAFLELPEGLFLVGVTHGPARGSNGSCYDKGMWWNPSLEREFLNKASEKLGSTVRF